MRQLTDDEKDFFNRIPGVMFINPNLVPVRLLRVLAQNGVMTTTEVHEHIKNGTLMSLRGVGPATAKQIIACYTSVKYYYLT